MSFSVNRIESEVIYGQWRAIFLFCSAHWCDHDAIIKISFHELYENDKDWLRNNTTADILITMMKIIIIITFTYYCTELHFIHKKFFSSMVTDDDECTSAFTFLVMPAWILNWIGFVSWSVWSVWSHSHTYYFSIFTIKETSNGIWDTWATIKWFMITFSSLFFVFMFFMPCLMPLLVFMHEWIDNYFPLKHNSY